MGGHERIHKIINRDDKDALRRDWEVIEIDLQKAIDRYNKSPSFDKVKELDEQ